ncbi:MAG: ATP-binding protein [Lachnospiraceae bacterium]|nr:ATP-binding protein [Lachnospiraceae bacterium]MDY4971006.1 ATP-binding protein [Lachnospiraceae bacterium]
MKKKLLKQMIFIGISTAVAAFLLCTGVFYGLFRRQIMEELQGYGQVLSQSEEKVRSGNFAFLQGYRVTVVDSDGIVIYDSNVEDSAAMENHSNRPEIQEAEKEGEGYDSRLSKTLDKSMFYYAVRMEDGSIMRVSKESNSIWGLMFHSMPICVVICIMICFTCICCSKVLTDKLVEPIDRMAGDLQRLNTDDVYPELVPFITTIRKQHENIMKSALMRQQFTANVSHELKTPLTAISGYAELIENGMVPAKDTASYAARIHTNANRLLTLINDIIKLSELDDMESELKPELFDLSDLAKKCIDGLQMTARKRNVYIQFTGSGKCMLYADPSMIEELLCNLCDNAIRYNNPGGKVWVEISTRSGGRPVLTVRDTGIGIPGEALEHVCERFYRVDKSRSKSTGGTGLGLAIVKHIVSRHNAELEISSEPGIGTRISVIFPSQNKD